MMGKARQLLAKRSLSGLVVASMVLTAFAGVLFLSDSKPGAAQITGDLIVTNGTYTIDYDQWIDGNVEVRDNGILIVTDATVKIISNNDPALKHTITVGVDGRLELSHGTITTYLDQINPWPFLDIIVEDGGQLVASDNSVLQFPGNIMILNGGTVTLTDTVVCALDSVTGVVGPEITEDSADDGPAISLADSTLELYDSSILNLPEYAGDMAEATNISLVGGSTLLSVNSFIGVDFGPDNLYTHNAIELSDVSEVHLFGTMFEEYLGEPADMVPAIIADGESFVAIPTAKKVGTDDTGEPIADIQVSGDGNLYTVQPGETLAMESFTSFPAMTINSATLLVRYVVDSGYTGSTAIEWNLQAGTPASTGIVPNSSETDFVERSFTFPSNVDTTGEIATMDVTFVHGGGTGDVQFDSMAIVMTVGSVGYIYRWLDVTVGDEYGVPIGGATVSAAFAESSAFAGQPLFYYNLGGGVSGLPPASVLDYMGKDALSFGITESDGAVLMPFLTDVMSADQAYNSLYVGNFLITGTATVDTTEYSSTEAYSFPAYPAMGEEDQAFEMTVDLLGVSAESPDPARWLVVPPDLTIEDMTYYHAGDIIVAAGGTLTFRGATLQLVQAEAYEHTVYVDGTESNPGRLVFEDSVVTSEMAIKIVVQGYATLEVVRSALSGVEIVALEHSHVILDWATASDSITTAWNSHAVVDVTDSVLVQAPVLSGYSVGKFTNTSLPSIVVEDSAYALIYRWIHVRVYDGADQPLPGTTVTIRYIVGATEPVGSADSNLQGIASIKALATNLTSTGPPGHFVGNYRVNATYTFLSTDYYASEEIDVGVWPYTEPLGQNATYAVMTVPDVMPDLYVDQDSVPVSTYPVSPIKGQVTLVEATIQNVGTSYAYNILVEFYDDANNDGVVTDANLFGTAVIPFLAPDDDANVSAYWTAGYPLAPSQHRILVIVDPDNTVKESDESLASGYVLVTVQRLADILIESGDSDIYTQPTKPVLDTPCVLNAYVQNVGDLAATNVNVSFYDGSISAENLLGYVIVANIGPGGAVTASIIWTPDRLDVHVIYAEATWPFAELDKENNNGSRQITVVNLPDLVISSLSFSPGSVTSGGSEVTISAFIYNQAVAGSEPAPVTNPYVELYVGTQTGEPEQSLTVETTLTATTGVVAVQFTYLVPVVTEDTDVMVYLHVNQTQYPGEAGSAYDNNWVSAVLTIQDSRPNLRVLSSEISVTREGTNITSEVFGHEVTISAVVRNTGGQAATFMAQMNIVASDGEPNNTIMAPKMYNISGNNAVITISYVWTVSITDAGTYNIMVILDPANSISERDETDNIASRAFTINALQVVVTLVLDKAEYDAGQEIVIELTVSYDEEGQPGVPDLYPIRFALYDVDGNMVLDTQTEASQTDDTGVISGATVEIPEDLDTGTYYVRADVVGTIQGENQGQIAVSGVAEGPAIPLFVWYIVIAAVAAVVIGFTAYTYVYGLGKLVECGECGAFIPAASKRCPKCGVEFEVGTMKCSECAAWIPAESTECPNCGVKFAGEAEEEEDYLERMKKEYEEMTSKYRELARLDLGKKYSDKTFEIWWKAQPSYISFDDWLAKEEEKRKEGLVPCPVCGTPNPKEATVCHKCGTVFAVEKEAEVPPRIPPKMPPAAAPGAPPEAARPAEGAPGAPKMVIRRPIDRKVVPKKIIKTPLGTEESKEGEQ